MPAGAAPAPCTATSPSAAWLRISPPRNHFPLVAARRHVLIAGGIGITPLLSMAETLAARGAPFVLHHYTSSAADAPLLERLRTSAFAARTVAHHSDQGDTIRTEPPAELLASDPDTAVYVCGPDGFMTHVTARATAMRLAARPDPHRTLRPGSSVTCRRQSRHRVHRTDREHRHRLPRPRRQHHRRCPHRPWRRGRTLLRAGHLRCLPHPVLVGEPDHRDEVQTPDERAAGDRITICCSRARTPELLLGL